MVYEIADVQFSYEPQSFWLRQRLKPFCVQKGIPRHTYTAPQLYQNSREESVELLRWFSTQLMPAYNGMLVHAAAVSYKEKAYLLVAPSGTGKTTHARLWKQYVPNAQILNGDKPFLRCMGNAVMVYGSPWQGKENMGINAKLPLAGIFLLSRAQENRTQTLQPHQALESLMTATPVPDNASGVHRLLSLLEQILGSVPVCRLYCNQDPEAAQVALAWIKEKAGA